MKRDQIATILDTLQLSISTVFVPWSQSRNASEKYPSLNYKVTVKRADRDLFTCDYMMGCAHAPSYKQNDQTINTRDAVKLECETGRPARILSFIITPRHGAAPITPDPVDVFYSLTMDADAIDYTFEDWCSNYDYDTDSRKAEKIYNECIQQAIQLRAAIGETGLQQLREAYQDY